MNLARSIADGDKRALAKGITLVESLLPEDQRAADELLAELAGHKQKNEIIGITGVPGVGKSTFIESLGTRLVDRGKKIAVLAVDPSSPLNGGSILGDKTRMEQLSRHPDAFVRPSPNTGHPGGIARTTEKSILLCRAAGYDIIFVETVGVGQSEYAVASLVDILVLLVLPNAGDELQGIKRGIFELADVVLVNKADGENKALAQQAGQSYQNALSLSRSQTKVETCSSLEFGTDFERIWKCIQAARKTTSPPSM